MLCCDSRKYIDQLRKIQHEFGKKQATVIAPEFAWTFLSMSRTTVDALARIKVSATDPVMRDALKTAADYTPSELAIVLLLIYSAIYENQPTLSPQDILDSPFLRGIYAETPPLSREWYLYEGDEIDDFDHLSSPDIRLASDISSIEGALLLAAEGERVQADLQALDSVMAILLDGKIRYDYQGTELLRYTLETLAAESLAKAREVTRSRPS
jgi:hypothetical protein